jgi:hypothetical protein
MAEKIQINLSNDQKKSSDDQFLQAPRNWQKRSALLCSIIYLYFFQKKLFLLGVRLPGCTFLSYETSGLVRTKYISN